MARTDAPVKAKNDAYTGILFISLLALIGACVLLYLDYSQYPERTPPKAPNIELPKAGVPAPKGNVPVDKGTPMTMKRLMPEKIDLNEKSEVTSIQPLIVPPPAAPALIPALALPTNPPTPSTFTEDRKVQPASFERIVPVKPILDLTPTPMVPPVVAPTTPPAAIVPLSPPTLLDEPPVLRPFVPNK